MNQPAQNPERAALAAAIVERDKAVAGVTKAQAAVKRGEDRLRAVRAELVRAQGDTEKARLKAKRAAGTDVAIENVSLGLRAMRGREQECADDVMLFEEAATQLAQDLADAKRGLYFAQDAVEKCARAVVALELSRALDRAQKLQRELISAAGALKEILGTATHERTRDRYSPEETKATSFLWGLTLPSDATAVASATTVHAYFERLKTDASASLE